MTDDAGMDTQTTSPGPLETRTPPPRPLLVRPVAGRAIGGVAAGLANHLALPVALLRGGFALATVFGGLGLFLYVAGWLLIRDERETESLAKRLLSGVRGGPAWVGVGLIGLGILLVFDRFWFFDGGPDGRRTFLWALIFVVVGVLLYRGELGSRSAPENPEGPQPATPNSALVTQEGEDGGATPPPPPPVAYVPPSAPPTPPPPPSILGRLTIGVALVAVGALAVLDNVTTVIDPQPRHYLALTTLVLGAGLLTGSVIGRARWLILLGVLVVPPLLASPVAEVDWEAGFDRTIAPAALADLQPEYVETAGRLVFDLTQVDWNGETIPLRVELAAGEVVIYLPENVGLTGTGQVTAGEVRDPSGERAGLGDITRTFSMAGDSGTLDVDLQIGFGSIRIESGREPLPSVSGRFLPFDEDDLADIDRAFGDITLDLRRLELDSDAQMRIELGAGTIEVLVPDWIDVDIDASAGAGRVEVLGTIDDGFGSGVSLSRTENLGPVLSLDLEVGTGDVTVTERQR